MARSTAAWRRRIAGSPAARAFRTDRGRPLRQDWRCPAQGPQRCQPASHRARANQRMARRVRDSPDHDRGAAGRACQESRRFHVDRDGPGGSELGMVTLAHQVIHGGDGSGPHAESGPAQLASQQRCRPAADCRGATGDLVSNHDIANLQVAGQAAADPGDSQHAGRRGNDAGRGRRRPSRAVAGPDHLDLITGAASAKAAAQRAGLDAEWCTHRQPGHSAPPRYRPSALTGKTRRYR